MRFAAPPKETSNMQHRVLALFAAGLFASAPTWAGPTEDLARTCNACHGMNGVSVGPSMPSIGGLPESYLKHMMIQWKTGERYSATMGRHFKGYSDEELASLAAYFAKLPWVPVVQTADPGTLAKGKAATDRCETCHGGSAEHNRVCREAAQKGLPAPKDLKIMRGGRSFTASQNNDTCNSCHAKMIPLSTSFTPGAAFFDHFDLVTTRGTLRLHDPRRFGAVVYVQGEADPVAVKLLGGLGVEPLTDAFEVKAFHQALRGRKTNIKQVLLAGDIVVGVGNIYASEALFLAGIRPTVRANRISLPRAARLHQAIRDVLTKALRSGGSTLRNFSNAHGQSGHFQLEVMVYDRAGEPCRVCGTSVRMLRQGQRSTFYCPRCQKP
jgi:DNA-formamidopyrimidine glycosylase